MPKLFSILFLCLTTSGLLWAETQTKSPLHGPLKGIFEKPKSLDRDELPNGKLQPVPEEKNIRWVCGNEEGLVFEGKLGQSCSDVLKKATAPFDARPDRRTADMPKMRVPKGPFFCKKEVFDLQGCGTP